MIIIDYSTMIRRRKYLVRQKTKRDADGKVILTSPDIREWECLEATGSFFKVVDLVQYRDVENSGGLFGGM